mmetsp:Transcript_6394/g.12440  ORF Transcript_6394/g.12440 Transcript_6394/m.12440 type:complete len:224 (-) Transcript_6394:530-1201(-)
MADVSALFSQYESDYCNKSTEISNKTDSLPTFSGDARQKKIKEIEVDLSNAEQLLKKMDYEARGVSPDKSKLLTVKIKDYKTDLNNLKEKFKNAQSAVTHADAARAELGLSSSAANNSGFQKDRMSNATTQLQQTDARLEEGKRLLYETEDVGANILSELQSQRETIMRSRDTLRKTDDTIGRARKLLSAMTRRMMQNKVLLVIIILILLGGIGLIIYFKLKK